MSFGSYIGAPEDEPGYWDDKEPEELRLDEDREYELGLPRHAFSRTDTSIKCKECGLDERAMPHLSDDVGPDGRLIPFEQERSESRMSEPITKNSRTVIGVVLDGGYYHVGSDGITAIEPYDETGQMAHVPWFNVWRGQDLYCKVNAAHVHVVTYKEPDDDRF